MADNTIIQQPSTPGDTIATEDIGGVKIPVSKIVLGDHGVNDETVSDSNPLPITGEVDVVASVLPTGAATAAKQPALGAAGSPSADVLTIQGHASMTPVKVDGSSVSISNFPGTQPVSASALPLPAGAATAAKQPALGTAGSPSIDVITVQGSSSGTAIPVTTTPVSSVYMNLDLGITGQMVKSSAGSLCGYFVYNNAASTRYVKFYNKATAATNSDTPVFVLAIPGGSAANVFVTGMVTFTTGISIRATTGVANADNNAPTANDVVVNVFYN